MVHEIAIISGKGGTGKTSLLLSMIPYFKDIVIADCDVDAPDVHILLTKDTLTETDFIGFQRPIIDATRCTSCQACYTACKFDAITPDIKIKEGLCEGCGVCEYICPEDAIQLEDYVIGKVYLRATEYGPLVDARLHPGEESSGKLVTNVRETSKTIANNVGANTILIDGSPGVACNVISTITGVAQSIIVTEPTVSGLHDLTRVISLTDMFHTEVGVVINKFDINLDMTDAIETYCIDRNIPILLRIPFDPNMVKAISNHLIPSQASIPFFQSKEWTTFISSIQKG
jgi:MinD superfamily P-loop ATPase